MFVFDGLKGALSGNNNSPHSLKGRTPGNFISSTAASNTWHDSLEGKTPIHPNLLITLLTRITPLGWNN